MNSKLLAAVAVAFISPAWSAEPAAKAQPTSYSAPTASQEQAISQFRNDLMADRADVMAKGLKLSADQAAKFWPLFEAFQKEQSDIVEVQVKAVKDYADHFANLSDEGALTYVNSLLERDQKMHDLRVKWLKKFQAAVPAKTAATAIQLDRRLGAITQVQLSSQIPLIR
jgi:Spy/CpxP family protein refolding chaperone